MLNTSTSRKVLIWLLLYAVVIGGILSSCALFQQSSVHQTPTPSATLAATTGTAHSAQRSVPAHKVSYTSAAYYKQLPAKLQSLLPPGTKFRANPIHSDKHISLTNGSANSTAHFTIYFMAPNQANATHGVPISVCASSDDDGVAEGEDVFLTADNSASFLASLITLDTTGCAKSTLFAPNKGNVTVYAAINYITPAFNSGGDEAGTYFLPAIAKSQIDITTTSKPISAAAAFGAGRGSSPFAGESVNLALGNYIYQHTDITLPVHGGSISLTRTYNSLDTSDGPFGVGWSFSYHQYLTIYSDKSVSVTYSDGHHEDYVFNNGTYIPVAGTGILSQLTELDGVYTVLHKDQSQDNYDASGKLISISNSKGDAIALGYNSADQLIEVYDGFSYRGLSFDYDSNEHIVNVTDTLYQNQNPSQSKVYTYTYDGNNHLEFVTDPLGNTLSYTYSNSHNLYLLSTVVDAFSNVGVANRYDSSNRVISQKNALGATTTFTYNTGSTIVTDPNMNSATYAYDFFYRQISATNSLGDITDYTYDDNGELRTVTDGNNNTVEYTYDENGNLKSIVDAIGVHDANPNGHMTTYAYDKQNHLLEMVDANGHKTIYKYDVSGNVTRVIDALGGVTQLLYDTFGDLVKSISPDGGQHTTTYAYNTYGDQTTITDGFGKTQTISYNVDGLPIEIKDANGHNMITAYDLDSHIVSVTDSLKNTVSYIYDQNGNRVSVTNADGYTTDYVYDALNRLIKVNNPDNTSIQYLYDAVGNLVKQLDQAQHPTTYTYDKNNQVLSVKDALGYVIRYSYDGAGNIITRTDANNQITSYIYDANNALKEVDYANSTLTKFTYDGMGNRLTMTDANGTSSYTFDKLNRPVTTTDPMSHNLSMSYDPAGNLTGMTYPDGRMVNYNYDNDNRLISVTDWANRTTTYFYDAAGNLMKMSMPNNVVTSYTYDVDNRLTGVSNSGPDGVISAFQYTLDGIGDRSTVKSSGSSTELGKTVYSYDSMERLLSASYPDGSSVAYKYDTNGNRSKMVNAIGNTAILTPSTPTTATPTTPISTTTIYTYNSTDELTQIVSGTTKTSMSYDNNGNLTASQMGATTTKYQYNAQEELTSVINGTSSVGYSYNGDGFRISKAVTTNSSKTLTQYVLSPTQTPQVLEEVTGNETIDELYGSSLLATVPKDTTSNPFYYSYDGLGSVHNITDSTGKVLSSYNYDAFGALRSSTGSHAEFQFNGQQTDAEDGLTYLRSRYYDPTLGRYIMRDTDPGIPNEAQTLNHYVYANSDPINLSDPTGKIGVDTIVAFIAGAIVGAVASILTQAIYGKGINWAEVGFDAVISGLIFAVADAAPELVPAALATFAQVGVWGTGNAVQAAGDYCFSACGTSDFSGSGLIMSAGLGAFNGIAFGELDISGRVGEGVGEELSKISSRVENDAVGNFLNRLSDSPIGEKYNARRQLVGSFPEGIVIGVTSGIEARITDTFDQRLKQFNASGANS